MRVDKDRPTGRQLGKRSGGVSNCSSRGALLVAAGCGEAAHIFVIFAGLVHWGRIMCQSRTGSCGVARREQLQHEVDCLYGQCVVVDGVVLGVPNHCIQGPVRGFNGKSKCQYSISTQTEPSSSLRWGWQDTGMIRFKSNEGDPAGNLRGGVAGC